MRPGRDRYRRHGGYVHAGFLAMLVIGGVTGYSAIDEPTPTTDRCTPVEAYDPLLTDNGWTADGGLLYPPGCEGSR